MQQITIFSIRKMKDCVVSKGVTCDDNYVLRKLRSIRGLQWELYDQDENIVAHLMRRLNISEF